MDTVKIYKTAEFAKLVGVSIKTIQRWDNKGVLKARRTITNRRYYTNEELDLALGRNKKN